MSKLTKIQSELKAPKNQFNKFGGFKYRSCEDILEALKPLLIEQDLYLVMSDEVVPVGDRIYVKATVTLCDEIAEGEEVRVLGEVTAWAREAEAHKGMDPSQITGAASSYARKYALGGLFLVDDGRDADSREETHNGDSKKKSQKQEGAVTSGHGTEAERKKMYDALSALTLDVGEDIMNSVLRLHDISDFRKIPTISEGKAIYKEALAKHEAETKGGGETW